MAKRQITKNTMAKRKRTQTDRHCNDLKINDKRTDKTMAERNLKDTQ